MNDKRLAGKPITRICLYSSCEKQQSYNIRTYIDIIHSVTEYFKMCCFFSLSNAIIEFIRPIIFCMYANHEKRVLKLGFPMHMKNFFFARDKFWEEKNRLSYKKHNSKILYTYVSERGDIYMDVPELSMASPPTGREIGKLVASNFAGIIFFSFQSCKNICVCTSTKQVKHQLSRG